MRDILDEEDAGSTGSLEIESRFRRIEKIDEAMCAAFHGDEKRIGREITVKFDGIGFLTEEDQRLLKERFVGYNLTFLNIENDSFSFVIE